MKKPSEWRITISKGNRKMGNIPSFSVYPLKTCTKEACYSCGKNGCYAVKLARIYKNVADSWMENTMAVVYDIQRVYHEIYAYIKKHNCEYFRYDVAGDFFSELYFKMTCELASDFPATRFLAFTKQYDVILNYIAGNGPIPANFSLIVSAPWDKQEAETNKAFITLSRMFPVAYTFKDVFEFDGNTMLCPGNCIECTECFYLRDIGFNVAFKKH